MNTVKTEHRFSERVLAFFLVIMMFFTSMPESLFSVSAVDDEFQISIKWNDDMPDKENYNYESDSPETRDIHLQVAFSNKQVSEAYAPGELIITVPGIKDAVRSGNSYIASSVAADKEGSGSKIYNWSYSYTEATDTYTFTNNFAVEKQSVFEGTFEIVWSLPSRETIDYFSKTIQAEMFIPGKGENSSAKTIQSNVINYSQKRVKDNYELNIKHTSIKGIKKSEDEKDLKVVYDISCSDDYKSKDVFTDELFEFWFLSDATVSGGGLAETDETRSDFGDGKIYKKYTYVKNITNTNPLSLKDIVVVYPGKYDGETVIVYGYAYGKYYEEDYPAENTIGEELTKAIYTVALDHYDYEDIPGDVYDVTKESYGIHNMTIDQKYPKYGAIDSANLTDGKGDYYSDLKIRLKFHNERDYISHDLEFVDDILDVNMKDGTIQQLTDDEYHFTKIRIPPKSEILDDKNKPITGSYSIVIKGRRANSAKNLFNIELGTCTLSDEEQIIDISENDIVGVSVCFKGVTENIGYLYNPNTSQTMVRCYYAFHMKKENVENVMLPDGHVINNMFFRLYNNYTDRDSEWANTGYSLENGEYSTDREYKRDLGIYKAGVDREKDDTPIIEIPNEFSIRQVKLESLDTADKSAYHFNGLIEGSFNLGDGTSLENFSMYMIVPEGLRIEEMYNNPDNLLSKLNFSASNGMTSAYIASHVKIKILQDGKYNGRQYIQFNFDFSDNPIQTKTLMINGVPMYADKNEFEQGKSYNYTLHGALLVNQGGKWNSRHTDSYAINGNNDIDGDGDIEEPADFASHNIRFTYAEETFVELKKYVKTPLTNGLVSPEEGEAVPKTYAGGDYSYILKAAVSKDAEESGGATNIIFADVIESKTQDNSEWQGEFVGIDYSKALAQLTYSSGTKPEPTIYYSTEEFAFEKEEGTDGAKHNKFNRETFTDNPKSWTTEKPTDAKQIRSVAVDFGDGVAKPGATLQIEIKMKAPESSENFNKNAENRCSISYEKINTGGGDNTEEHLDSNIVPVTYVAKGRIVLTKKDATDHSVITGATFELYKSSGDKVGKYTVDQNGRLVVNDLEYGKYYFKETSAPKGYKLDSRPVRKP